MLLAALAFVACLPSRSPLDDRATARAALLVTAQAVGAADRACAEVADARADVDLAHRCAVAYRAAARALRVGAGVIDSGAGTTIACEVAQAAAALGDLVAEVRGAGAKVPPVAEDALRLAAAVGGCHA